MRHTILAVLVILLLAATAQAQSLSTAGAFDIPEMPSIGVSWPSQPTPDLAPAALGGQRLILEPVARWGERGREAGQFLWARGVAYDAAHDFVFVADYDLHRIQVFHLDGQFVRTFGRIGDGPAEFINPIDVVVLESGLVLVADYGNDRIQALTAEGEYQYEWSTRDPVDIDIGPGGLVFANAWSSVTVYDSQGGEVRTYRLMDNLGNRVTGSLAIGDANMLYVADNSSYRTLAYDLEGTYLFHWYHRDGQQVSAFADGPGGLLYFIPYDESILHAYDKTGAYLDTVRIAVGGPGRVAEVTGTNPAVLLITSSNSVYSYRLYWGCPLHLPLVLRF